MAQGVLGPRESAVPWKSLPDARLAVIPHRYSARLARPLACGGRHEERVAIAAIRELSAVLHDAVHFERHLEIDLHLRSGAQHAVGNAIPTADARIARVDAHMEVVELHVPPRACGPVGAPQRVGMRIARGRRVLRERDNRETSEERDHGDTNTRSPANLRPLVSQEKKITTRNVTRWPVGARSSH